MSALQDLLTHEELVAMQSAVDANTAVVSVYCDASCIRAADTSLIVGAWAYVIPELNLEAVAPHRGDVSNTELEMIAAVEGCKAAADAYTGRGLRLTIHSDCSFTEAWIMELNRREAGVSKRIAFRVAPSGQRSKHPDIIVALNGIVARYQVTFSRTDSIQSEWHRRCHDMANKCAHESMTKDERVLYASPLKLQKIRSTQQRLLKEIRGLEGKIQGLENSISARRTKIARMEEWVQRNYNEQQDGNTT